MWPITSIMNFVHRGVFMKDITNILFYMELVISGCLRYYQWDCLIVVISIKVKYKYNNSSNKHGSQQSLQATPVFSFQLFSCARPGPVRSPQYENQNCIILFSFLFLLLILEITWKKDARIYFNNFRSQEGHSKCTIDTQLFCITADYLKK